MASDTTQQTEAVLNFRLEAVVKRDLDDIMRDVAQDVVLFRPDGPLIGYDKYRNWYAGAVTKRTVRYGRGVQSPQERRHRRNRLYSMVPGRHPRLGYLRGSRRQDRLPDRGHLHRRLGSTPALRPVRAAASCPSGPRPPNAPRTSRQPCGRCGSHSSASLCQSRGSP